MEAGANSRTGLRLRLRQAQSCLLIGPGSRTIGRLYETLSSYRIYSLALLVSSAFAQQSWEDQLDERLVQHFKKTMRDWTHERVEPIAGSKDMLIQFWSLSNRKANVSILLHDSVEKAREVIQNHVRYSFTSETLMGIGDEAYSSPGYASSMVAFRRGKFTVLYIHTRRR